MQELIKGAHTDHAEPVSVSFGGDSELGKGENKSKPVRRHASDAELVDLTIAGDVRAFDRLVIRHREVVLRAARSVLGDWHTAEDAAQHALLEAYKNLRGLREADKFRPWLMTIARRCALRLVRSEPERTDLTAAIMQPVVDEPFLPDSLADQVRTHLAELSDRNRRVIALHYLDGYSCREIGAQLSIAEGTVKRVLHESRNDLRASIGARDPTTGGTKMQTAKKKTGPRHMSWWINGNWPGQYMGSLLAQSICLAANKTPKSVAEIAKEIGAHPDFVSEAAGPLLRENLLTESGARIVANFIALSADDWISITADVRRYGQVLADRLEARIPELAEAWAKSALPDRGFPWSEGMWLTTGLFVCNHGVHRNSAFPREPAAPVHGESGKTYWSGGCEDTPEEYRLWGVGFNNWSPTPDVFRYGYFWTSELDRDHLSTSKSVADVLEALDEGLSDADSIARRACAPLDQTRDRLAELVRQGVVTQDNARLSLSFPVIRQEDSDALSPTIDGICGGLSSEILGPGTADVSDRLNAAGYGHLADQFPAWRRWFAGYICGEALKELLNRGALPDPGCPAPARFGLVGWKGPLRILS